MINKFNNKDLLKNIRQGVLNPMVDATNTNTLGVNILKQDVSFISRRVGTIEPIVTTNSQNLTALNRFAQAVAQQVSLAYDKAYVDNDQKLVTFTSIGGVEKSIDLSQMFIDPVGMEIEVSSDKDPDDTFSVHKLNFKENADLQIRRESTPTGNYYVADIAVPKIRGQVEGSAESDIRKVIISGNVGASQLQGGTLRIELPKSGSGSGAGFFLDPNPPEAGKNFFLADTQALAEQARDGYFTNNPNDLKTYDDNILKCILVEWKAGADDLQLQLQSRHNNQWVNPFKITFSSFLISAHNISELKDGNRVATLEAETVKDVESIGGGSDIFKEKRDRKIILKKLKSESDDLEISDSRGEGLTFRTNPYWKGYYESTTAATTDIHPSDRIKDKTTIIALNDVNEPNMYIWDGAKWDDKDLAGHVEVQNESGEWKALKNLKAGKNVKLKMIAEGPKTVYKIDVDSAMCGKLPGGQNTDIDCIEVASKYAEIQGTVLKLPTISALNRDTGDLGQIKNIKQGDNVEFELEESTGVLTIKATATAPTSPITVKLKDGQEKTLKAITENDKYSTLTNDGVLTLHSINTLDSNGAPEGPIKDLKAGTNVTLERDSSTGVVTVNSTGGGGSGPGSINATVGLDTNTTIVTTIHSESVYSKIENGILNIHAIDCNNGTDKLGLVKTLKAGSNVTFTRGNTGDEDGVLTIEATGGGSGGSIQAKVDGSTSYVDITKIEALKMPATIDGGVLKLSPVVYKRSNGDVIISGGVKTVKAGIGIGFGEDDDDDADDNTIVINNEGMLKGKIKTESSTNPPLKQVEQINFTSDASSSKTTQGSTGTVLELDIRGFPAGASTLSELQSKFPVTDNAYRHGYTGTDKATYFAHVSGTESDNPSGEWKLHNYYGMADEVKSSTSRFPEQTTETSKTYDPEDIKNGYRYFSQQDSAGFFPEAADQEFGILENITASKKRRSQMFYGMESGGVWFRHMSHLTTEGADTDFKGWQQIAGVSEEYHSILTVPSFKIIAKNNEIDGVRPLPWMVMQDPKCNVSVDSSDNSLFVVNKDGTYDITTCFHITTASGDSTTTPVKYTFQLKKAVDGSVLQTIEKTVTIPSSDPAKGFYPPVRVTFPNVKVVRKTSDSFRVVAKVDRADTLLSKTPYLDSFKNYLVVQPSSSNTKQGIVIAEGFRRAFGGFSSKPGYEVHVEGTTTGSSSVRVYGALVNDKLQV